MAVFCWFWLIPTHTYILTYIHAHTYTHTHTYILTHTHIHVYPLSFIHALKLEVMQKKKTLRDLIGLQVRGSHGKTNDLHSSMRVIGVSPANMLPTEQRVAWSTGKSKGVTSQKVAQGEVTAWNHKGVLLCKLSLHPQSTPWLKSSHYPCSSRGCAGDTGLCHCGGVEGLSK